MNDGEYAVFELDGLDAPTSLSNGRVDVDIAGLTAHPHGWQDRRHGRDTFGRRRRGGGGGAS